jgi:hypothetical protein
METWLIILTVIAAIFLIVRKVTRTKEKESDSNFIEDISEDVLDLFGD